MMSREARVVISRMIEIDPKRRYRASELLRDPFISCKDLPLSIFETAGSMFRASSVDKSITTSHSRADGFNRNIQKLHSGAVEHLKSLGFSNRAIEESMKPGDTQNV